MRPLNTIETDILIVALERYRKELFNASVQAAAQQDREAEELWSRREPVVESLLWHITMTYNGSILIRD